MKRYTIKLALYTFPDHANAEEPILLALREGAYGVDQYVQLTPFQEIEFVGFSTEQVISNALTALETQEKEELARHLTRTQELNDTRNKLLSLTYVE